MHWKDYLSPRSLVEALEMLAQHQGKARVLAGGTDLIPQFREGSAEADHLVDITQISNLDYIRENGGGEIAIGALATHSQLATSELLKSKVFVLAEASQGWGGPQIREQGTIGGNVVNAQPAADGALALVALEARATVVSKRRTRMVPVEELFVSPGVSRVDSTAEILQEISFALPDSPQGSAFLRLAKRRSLALPILAAAIVVSLDRSRSRFRTVRIALGPVAPTPQRAREAEQYLEDRDVTAEVVQEAAEIASQGASPRESIRGSQYYRKEMVKVLVRRGVDLAVDRAREGSN
ncbi:MAG: FAD binding domain-containing protein [Chloroflexi bacterium]|nr:FAD binding domain-containing protein [Chloroflexota bacterium]